MCFDQQWWFNRKNDIWGESSLWKCGKDGRKRKTWKCIQLLRHQSRAGSTAHICNPFHQRDGHVDLQDGWAWKGAKEVKDIPSMSIEQNWVAGKSKDYGKCLQKLSVSIKSRKRGRGAKKVLLAIGGKDSVCTWVRVMVSAEKHPLYCTTATKCSMTDSDGTFRFWKIAWGNV